MQNKYKRVHSIMGINKAKSLVKLLKLKMSSLACKSTAIRLKFKTRILSIININRTTSLKKMMAMLITMTDSQNFNIARIYKGIMNLINFKGMLSPMSG
jgi:hypothetical protein